MPEQRTDSIHGQGSRRSKAKFIISLLAILVLGFFAIRFVINRSAGNKEIIPPDVAEEALSGLDVQMPKIEVSK